MSDSARPPYDPSRDEVDTIGGETIANLKRRFFAAIEEKEALEARILEKQAPLVENRAHPDRPVIVAQLNELKAQVMPLSKEITSLAKMLHGKLV